MISEWNDLSNSGPPLCLEDSHQMNAQEKIRVGICCLKNSKMAVYDFICVLVSMLYDASHQVSAQENMWVGRGYLKNSKKAV